MIHFTYDSQGHLLTDSYGDQETTYTYSSMTGALVDTNTGLGRTMGLVPSSIQGLQTTPARSTPLEGVAVETDPLGRVTTYTLDSLGLETRVQMPDGGVQTWQCDFAGQPTVFTDELGRVTTYTYQYGTADGELTPGHKPQRRNDPLSVQLNVPRGHRDDRPAGAGDDLDLQLPGRPDRDHRPDGAGDDRGLVQRLAPERDRPAGPYDAPTSTTASARRPNRSTRMGRITTYTYDSAGDQITVEDPMGRVTTTVYDAHAARSPRRSTPWAASPPHSTTPMAR